MGCPCPRLAASADLGLETGLTTTAAPQQPIRPTDKHNLASSALLASKPRLITPRLLHQNPESVSQDRGAERAAFLSPSPSQKPLDLQPADVATRPQIDWIHTVFGQRLALDWNLGAFCFTKPSTGGVCRQRYLYTQAHSTLTFLGFLLPLRILLIPLTTSIRKSHSNALPSPTTSLQTEPDICVRSVCPAPNRTFQ